MVGGIHITFSIHQPSKGCRQLADRLQLERWEDQQTTLSQKMGGQENLVVSCTLRHSKKKIKLFLIIHTNVYFLNNKK